MRYRITFIFIRYIIFRIYLYNTLYYTRIHSLVLYDHHLFKSSLSLTFSNLVRRRKTAFTITELLLDNLSFLNILSLRISQKFKINSQTEMDE